MRTILAIICCMGCLTLGLITAGFCAEELTITTYYPSPYGSYNELTVSGNVGIGMTGPTVRLDILGSGATSATTSVRVRNSSGTSLLLVRDDGNVGVGNTNPTVTLDVGGTVRASSFSSGALTGMSGTLTVRDSGGGTDCNIVVTNGIITSSTC